MATFEQAARIALGNREVKKVRVAKHEFNIKPLMWGWRGDALHASGKLSHCKAVVRDDQIEYEIDIKYGQTLQIKEQLRIEEAHGWTSLLVPPITDAISHIPYVGGAIAIVGEPLLSTVGRQLEASMVDKNYRDVAGGIVEAITAALIDRWPRIPGPHTSDGHCWCGKPHHLSDGRCWCGKEHHDQEPGARCWCGKVHKKIPVGTHPR